MTSPDGHRRKLAQLKSSESKLRRDEGKYTGDASKKKGEAARKRTSARRASSASTRERYEREVAKLEEQAATLTDKAAAVGRTIATNLEHQRQEQGRLRRAESSAQRQRDREDGRWQTNGCLPNLTGTLRRQLFIRSCLDGARRGQEQYLKPVDEQDQRRGRTLPIILNWSLKQGRRANAGRKGTTRAHCSSRGVRRPR